MGLSLVGNSGDQSTTNNVYETSYSASINPQFEQSGSGPGALALDLAPTLQGSAGIRNYSPTVSDYYAPLNIVSTGSALGDSALSTLGSAVATQTAATDTTGTSSASSDPLASLFSGNTIYYILGGLVLLFLAHHKS